MLRPSLGLVQLLVTADAPPPDKSSRDTDQQASDENKSTTETVEGLVGARPEVGAEPVAALADAVGDTDESRLLAPWGWHHLSLPGKLQVETVVGTRDEDEEGKIAHANVGNRNEESAADGGDENGNHDVPVVLLATAGGPCAQTGEGVGEGIRRGLDEVGGELAKVEGVDDLRTLLVEVSGGRGEEAHTEGRKSLKA
jgi:hypothetical protein